MAVDPNTLLPGALADANEVQLKFDRLFTDIDNDNIAADAAIAVSKLASMTTGQVLVGTAAGVPTIVTMSGGATINDTGVVALSGTFGSGSLRLADTAGDHDYIFTAGGDLAADRNVTLPLLGANDTFVFESATQTLNNKTLLSPTIANFSNAQHDHQSGGAGGFLDTAAINSGTFANARISAGNVTQHEGSITHNNLAGLTTGDPHTQYLLVSGTRAMSGTLNMNSNRIDFDSDNDTSLRASADDTLTLEMGGTDVWTIISDGQLLLPDVDIPEANYGNRNGFAKAWISIQNNGAFPNLAGIYTSYNIDTISGPDALNQYTIYFGRVFSSANYVIAAAGTFSTNQVIVGWISKSAGNCVMQTSDDTGTLNAIFDFDFVCFGDQ